MTADLSDTQGDTPEEINPSTKELTKRKYTKTSQNKCSAKSSRTGKPCEKAPVAGATVCRFHGGAAPQVQRAARVRLEMAADKLAQRLLKFAFDGQVPDTVALTAIRDALDRAGLSAKTAVELGISVKPFEAILDRIDSGSRAEFRRSMGIEEPEEPQQIALPKRDDDDDLIVEAEVVDADNAQLILNDDDDDYGGSAPFHGPDGQPWGDAPNPFGPDGPPPDQGMVPLSEAVTAQAEMRKHAVLRPIQRALPRGRSQ